MNTFGLNQRVRLQGTCRLGLVVLWPQSAPTELRQKHLPIREVLDPIGPILGSEIKYWPLQEVRRPDQPDEPETNNRPDRDDED